MEQLSGLDASFLYIDTPATHMQVGLTAILDPSDMPGGYSFRQIHDWIAERASQIPALRRRLVKVPANLHHPHWVQDPDFDVVHHLRLAVVPAPGDLQALGDLVGRLARAPLDRSRPLWEAWVLEGLEGGRFALFFKFHHCAVDGASAVELAGQLFTSRPGSRPPGSVATVSPEPLPREIDLMGQALRSRLQTPARMLKLLGPSLKAVGAVAYRRRTAAGPTGALPLTAPRTHFNRRVSAQRKAAFADVPLELVKAVKNATGTKVNDVVLAICAGALRGYLEDRDALPEQPLTAVCPISVRTADDRGTVNNRVSAMWATLATQIDDPLERLAAIHADVTGSKIDFHLIGPDMLHSWAELGSAATVSAGARLYARLKLAERFRPIHNLVLSNVPGPSHPLYLGDARLEAVYPTGPVMEETGLNLTVLSYCDRVFFGFNVDPTLMPDVWDLAGRIRPALEELVRATSRSRRAHPRHGHRPSAAEHVAFSA